MEEMKSEYAFQAVQDLGANSLPGGTIRRARECPEAGAPSSQDCRGISEIERQGEEVDGRRAGQ
eukprot:10906731-Heterocapsa_arctica.AAC.1